MRLALRMRHSFRFLVIAAMLSTCFACSSAKYSEPSQLRRAIEQKVPIDATKEQVVAFLKSEGIEHHYDSNDPKDEDIRGLVRDASGIFIKASIRVEFNFDSAGRLADYEVSEVLTGP